MLARLVAAVSLVVLIAGAAPRGVRAPASAPQTPSPAQAPAPGAAAQGRPLTPEQIVAALKRPENSTGNVADAVEEVTGARGWMAADMKPIMDGKIVGRAWTAKLRPVLKNDTRTYPNHLLQVLDEAPAGSVLVYVMEGGLEIAAIGNLMATTAQVRGLEGTVIDGAVAGCDGTAPNGSSGLRAADQSRDLCRSDGERFQADAGDVRGCHGQPGRLHRGRCRRRRRGAAQRRGKGARAARAVQRQGIENGGNHQAREVDAEGARDLRTILRRYGSATAAGKLSYSWFLL